MHLSVIVSQVPIPYTYETRIWPWLYWHADTLAPKSAHCSAIGRRSVDYIVELDFCLSVSFNLVGQIALFKWPTRTHESRNTAIFNPSLTIIYRLHYPKDLSRYAPSPWETSLHCNDVSHCLGAYLDWPLPASILYQSCWPIQRSHIIMKSVPISPGYYSPNPSKGWYRWVNARKT